MNPSLDFLIEKRLPSKREIPCLRVVHQFLQLQVCYLYSTLPREVD